MIHVAAAVIIRKGQVLLASRPPDKPPAGWEFPGGKLEPGEDAAAAAVRELREELALEVVPGEVIHRVRKPELLLEFIRCRISDDAVPRPCEGQCVRWEDPAAGCPDGLLENDREFWNFLISLK